MGQYDKLINLGLLSQFLTKAKTIFAPKITASGILKGDGAGNVSAATAGTDYEPAGLGLAGASVGDLVRVNAVDANGKPTSWKKAPLNEIKCNKNLLDNWYFVGGGSQLGDGVFPINQRGQTSYSGQGYCVDRVKSYNSYNTMTVTADGLKLSNNTSNKGYVLFSPRETLPSGDLTWSLLINDILYYNTNSFKLLDNGWNVYIDKNNKCLVIGFKNYTGNDVIKAAKLELGSEQTLAHNKGTEANPIWVLNEIPDYGEELAKCQRYLYRYNCPTPHFTATDSYMVFPIVHEFASTPTSIISSADISWYRIDGIQTTITDKQLSIIDASKNSINIKLIPTPAPGSANKNKLGYITRLNTLISCEP